MIHDLPALDELLETYRSQIGKDFIAYRNHTHRLVNFYVALSPAGAADVPKVCVAAAFHDLGIWTDGTFDYLAPSVRLATDYLVRTRRAEWTDEITAMILEHHKVSTYRGPWTRVEPFRRADWIDVTLGIRSFGLSRATIAAIQSAWPSAGFHKRLVSLAWGRWRRHPLSPLPMVRL